MSIENKKNETSIFYKAVGFVEAIHHKMFEKQKEIDEHAKRTKERIAGGIRPPGKKFRL